MEYELTWHKRADCPYLILRGTMFAEDVEMLISTLIEQVIDKGEKCVLVDIREYDSSFSELEIISILRNFPTKLRALKTAILLTEKKAKIARLYESIVYSNGFAIRFFKDEEKAQEYLRG